MLRPKLIGAGVLLVVAASLAVYSVAAPNPKTRRLEAEINQILSTRIRHIDPAELLDVMHNNQMQLVILDVRDESDYNLFHIIDSRRLPPADWSAPWLKTLPPDSIKVLISNDETRAEEAFRRLMLAGIPHLYILEGGLNHWLDIYGSDPDAGSAATPATTAAPNDVLRHAFVAALGSRQPGADPDSSHVPARSFDHKVQPPKPITKMSGGCGG
jgi:rhodanese-related sulfurtransferase